VTVNDSSSLDINRMTLEAWVRPSTVNDWRTVLLKEQPGQLVYALYASTDNNRPSGHVFTTGDMALRGPSALAVDTWSHLAFTWDGATTRMYVNGTQVATAALTGNAVTSTGALRIGGNGVWNEWFSGAIDEVRVYNRALSAGEIATDRDTPIGGAAPLAFRGARAAAPVVRKRLGKAGRLTRDGRKVKAHRRTRWLNGAGSRSRAGRGSRAHRRAAHRRHRAGRRL